MVDAGAALAVSYTVVDSDTLLIWALDAAGKFSTRTAAA